VYFRDGNNNLLVVLIHVLHNIELPLVITKRCWEGWILTISWRLDKWICHYLLEIPMTQCLCHRQEVDTKITYKYHHSLLIYSEASGASTSTHFYVLPLGMNLGYNISNRWQVPRGSPRYIYCADDTEA
jgi:hypothetical protein